MHEGHQGRGAVPAAVERVGRAVLDASYSVHTALGPGLLETVYEHCLAEELRQAGLHVEQQVPVPVVHGSVKLEVGYRLDLLIERCVIVEVKWIDALTSIHISQVLTYLRFSGRRLGYLINFNTAQLKDGVRRIVL